MPAPAQLLSHLVARCGFDLPKLGHALAIVAMAFLALLLAWLLGLDHPQWAAITVLVTNQPSRGQTIEKNAYRFLGTILGSGYGLILVTSAGSYPWAIALGLAVWSGLCLFVGTLQKAYRSYGTVLAGYSAVIVAMNNVGPAEMVKWVALDRIAAIFLGVLAGIALSYLIAPAMNRREYEQRTRRILADMLRQVAVNLGQPRLSRPTQDYPILAAAGQLSSQMAGLTSHRGRPSQNTGPLQDLLVCGSALLLASLRAPEHPALAERMRDAAAALHEQRDYAGLQRRLTQALSHTHDPRLEEALITLASTLPDGDGHERGLVLAPAETHWHYDWRGARQAGLRIAMVTGSIGAVWAFTGEPLVQFALISAAIVVSLASSGVAPSRAMRDVLIGQILAATSAVLCEKLLWAQGLDGMGQVFAMLPSLIGYALVRAHRRLTLSATDYALTLLLMLTPTHAVYAEIYSPVWKGVMAVCGGVMGYVSFRWFFPVDARLRRKGLWRMIKGELQAIAAARPLAQGSAQAWRLRFVARYLKIVDWSFQEAGRDPAELTMRKGLLTLAIGELVFGLRRMTRLADLPSPQRRAIVVALQRIARSDRESPALVLALTRLQQRLAVWRAEEPQIEGFRGELAAVTAELLLQLDDLRQQRHARLRARLRFA